MKSIAIFILMFALGLGAAWWIQPTGSPTAQDRAKPAELLQSEAANKVPANDVDLARLDELVKNAFLLGRSSMLGRPEPKIPDFEVGEYPVLLDALCERAGLQGLGSDEAAAFEMLLMQWYEKAPKEAEAWLARFDHAADRMRFGEKLVEAAAATNYDEAVRLMRQLCRNQDDVVRIPNVLMDMAVKQGAEALVELLSYSHGTGGGIGHHLEYPEGFDFRTALDGYSNLAAKGIHPVTFPWNLLDEWANRDPEAAIVWAANHRSGEISMNLSEYFGRLDSPQKLASALGTIASAESPSPKVFTSMAIALVSKHSEDIPAVLAQFPSGEDAAKIRSGLLATTPALGAEVDEFRMKLLAGLSPNERLEMVAKVVAASGDQVWYQDSRDSLTATLVQLGHSPEQVSAIIPKAPDALPPRYGIATSVSFGSGFVPEEDGSE